MQLTEGAAERGSGGGGGGGGKGEEWGRVTVEVNSCDPVLCCVSARTQVFYLQRQTFVDHCWHLQQHKIHLQH